MVSQGGTPRAGFITCGTERTAAEIASPPRSLWSLSNYTVEAFPASTLMIFNAG